jgi:hypothetical protein
VTKKGEQQIKELMLDHFRNSIKYNDFHNTLSMMEKLDYATTNSFSVMYDYMDEDRKDHIEGELAVVKDYQTGKGDPSRVVARIERAARKKKDIVKTMIVRNR